MKVKISEAWNKHHGRNNVKDNNRTDLDLGDMLKTCERNQIEELDIKITRLQNLIKKTRQQKSEIKAKYKRITSKISRDPKVKMLTDSQERKDFAIRINSLGANKKTLGCSLDQFRIFLDVQLEDGKQWYNWTNKNVRNAWNVDHITEKQSGGSNHWSNFVPRDRKENLNKGKLESALNHYLLG
jgi:5-methylcytosine-specific restriction endonuclease McrA